MATFSDPVEVVMSTAGLPLRLRWRGHSYTLGAEPVRWFERRSWWVEESRAAPGYGAGLVDQEIWRVQAREGRSGPLLTFDLVRYLPNNAPPMDQHADPPADPSTDGPAASPADPPADPTSGRTAGRWRVLRLHSALPDALPQVPSDASQERLGRLGPDAWNARRSHG